MLGQIDGAWLRSGAVEPSGTPSVNQRGPYPLAGNGDAMSLLYSPVL